MDPCVLLCVGGPGVHHVPRKGQDTAGAQCVAELQGPNEGPLLELLLERHEDPHCGTTLPDDKFHRGRDGSLERCRERDQPARAILTTRHHLQRDGT